MIQQINWSNMKKENMLTDNFEGTGNINVSNPRESSIRILARVLGLKLTALNDVFVLLLNTISTKLVFATRNTLHRSILKTPAGLRKIQNDFAIAAKSERGDVPGWVLVVLMTTGLVTGIWTVAQPRLSSILKNSLDNMNSIR